MGRSSLLLLSSTPKWAAFLSAVLDNLRIEQVFRLAGKGVTADGPGLWRRLPARRQLHVDSPDALPPAHRGAGEGHAADHALREDDDAVYPGLFDAVLAGQRQMARLARMPG
jgi:hypothetical protein